MINDIFGKFLNSSNNTSFDLESIVQVFKF